MQGIPTPLSQSGEPSQRPSRRAGRLLTIDPPLGVYLGGRKRILELVERAMDDAMTHQRLALPHGVDDRDHLSPVEIRKSRRDHVAVCAHPFPDACVLS